VTAAGAILEGFTVTNGDASGMLANCSPEATGGCGGGILVEGAANVTIQDNLVTGNVAESAAAAGWNQSWGGGIYARNAHALAIESNTIAGNRASTVSSGQGAGIFLDRCQGARIAGNRVAENTATTVAGIAASGGGVTIYHRDSSGTVVEKNVFTDNCASTGTDASYGNALYTWYAEDVTIRDNWIASDCPGAAVYLGYFTGHVLGNYVSAGEDGSLVWLFNGQDWGNVLANNILVAGAGTTRVVDADGYVDYPLSTTLLHNTIVGNGESVGVYVGADATATLTNNIVVSHGTAMETVDNGVLLADHTLLWWNTREPILGAGPIHGDPLFVNRAQGDFHILPGSAAVDAATDAGVATDFDGEARPGLGGIDVGADELAPWQFDFGATLSPVAEGYAQVTHSTTFTPGRGYGWSSGTIGSRDRGIGDDLRRDFCFANAANFAVKLPNGRYWVTLTMGDATVGHSQMAVFVEGQPVATVSTAGNEFRTVACEVSVADGELSLWLDDEGGSDPNVVVNTLTIQRALPARIDLGTASSPVAPGFTRGTHASLYSPAAAFGWLGGIVHSRDRGTADPLRRDLAFSARALLGLFLGNGVYDLSLTLGDAAATHDQMGVAVQGTASVPVTAARNTFVARRWRTCVADNRLGALLADLGGADKNVVVNAVEASPPPPLRFDFGTPTSPVTSNHLQVTHATVYTPERGYGWLSGSIASRDRGTALSQYRDFNFTSDGTFVADLIPGRYEVWVLIGDATHAHDQMGIEIEGELVDVLWTVADSFANQTYTVTVRDGQLTVRLVDQGGGDPNVVINQLVVP